MKTPGENKITICDLHKDIFLSLIACLARVFVPIGPVIIAVKLEVKKNFRPAQFLLCIIQNSPEETSAFCGDLLPYVGA